MHRQQNSNPEHNEILLAGLKGEMQEHQYVFKDETAWGHNVSRSPVILQNEMVRNDPGPKRPRFCHPKRTAIKTTQN